MACSQRRASSHRRGREGGTQTAVARTDQLRPLDCCVSIDAKRRGDEARREAERRVDIGRGDLVAASRRRSSRLRRDSGGGSVVWTQARALGMTGAARARLERAVEQDVARVVVDLEAAAEEQQRERRDGARVAQPRRARLHLLTERDVGRAERAGRQRVEDARGVQRDGVAATVAPRRPPRERRAAVHRGDLQRRAA